MYVMKYYFCKLQKLKNVYTYNLHMKTIYTYLYASW